MEMGRFPVVEPGLFEVLIVVVGGLPETVPVQGPAPPVEVGVVVQTLRDHREETGSWCHRGMQR